jgi:hypothetical protein
LSIFLGRIADRTSTNEYEYYVDNLSDLNNLPTRSNGTLIQGKTEERQNDIPAVGSLCLVMTTSQVFILTSNGWTELGCDCNTTSTTTT